MNRFSALESTAPIGVQLIADLRERIVTGVFPPGMRLSEQEIATGYGMSRQPVREAFIKLAAERLVEIRPQRGTYVRKIDLEGVAHAQFVREAVEADIVRIAARHAESRWIDRLQGQIAEQRRQRAAGGAVFVALDEAFHQTLAAAAGRAGVWTHIEPIKMQMDRVRYLTASNYAVDHLVEQHEAVVAALVRGDAAEAEASIRRHLRGVLEDLRTIAASLPDYFEGAPEPRTPP